MGEYKNTNPLNKWEYTNKVESSSKKWIVKTKFHTGYINLFLREVEFPVPSWFAVSLSAQPADGGFWAGC